MPPQSTNVSESSKQKKNEKNTLLKLQRILKWSKMLDFISVLVLIIGLGIERMRFCYVYIYLIHFLLLSLKFGVAMRVYTCQIGQISSILAERFSCSKQNWLSLSSPLTYYHNKQLSDSTSYFTTYQQMQPVTSQPTNRFNQLSHNLHQGGVSHPIFKVDLSKKPLDINCLVYRIWKGTYG